MVDISKSTEFYQNQEQQSCAAKLCSKATFSVQKFMEINLNPGFFLPASEYFRRHKDVQKRHSGSLSPLLEALQKTEAVPCKFKGRAGMVQRGIWHQICYDLDFYIEKFLGDKTDFLLSKFQNFGIFHIFLKHWLSLDQNFYNKAYR